MFLLKSSFGTGYQSGTLQLYGQLKVLHSFRDFSVRFIDVFPHFVQSHHLSAGRKYTSGTLPIKSH